MKSQDLRIGDIILVHGLSTLADIIENFQKLENKLYGKWTHAMIVCSKYSNKVKVSESLELGIAKTNLQEYLDSGKELLVLRYKEANTNDEAEQFLELADYYSGRTRYNKVGLLQQAWKFFKRMFNKNAEIHPRNTDHRFMCGSWAAFNLYEIYNDWFFEKYTEFSPVELAISMKFELSILEK